VLLLGSAILATKFVAPRGPFTIAGIGILAWILTPLERVDRVSDDIRVLFVLTGLLLVLGAVLVIAFNAHEILRVILYFLERRRGQPVLRTGASYPIHKPFRTGMTVAIFTLILFTVTVIGELQEIQERSVESLLDRQTGGYDLIGYSYRYLPIGDFKAKIKNSPNISLEW